MTLKYFRIVCVSAPCLLTQLNKPVCSPKGIDWLFCDMNTPVYFSQFSFLTLYYTSLLSVSDKLNCAHSGFPGRYQIIFGSQST